MSRNTGSASKSRILQIVQNHPALEAIRQGGEVSDDLLVQLEPP